MSSGYKYAAGLKSSKIKWVGSDPDTFVYTDISSAVSACDPGDVVIIETGTYSLSETLTLNKNITLVGAGDVTVNGGTAGIADRLIMVNKPAAGTATTTVKLENIKFVNANASADVLECDNDGGGTGDMVLEAIDCGFDAGASGLSLDIDQTTNTINLYVRVASRLGLRRPMEGCNFALSKAASEVVIEGYDFGASVCALGTTDVASVYSWINCQFESAAFTSGGAASIIVNMQGCAKVASAAIAAVALTDLDATAASENLQAGTLAV